MYEARTMKFMPLQEIVIMLEVIFPFKYKIAQFFNKTLFK